MPTLLTVNTAAAELKNAKTTVRVITLEVSDGTPYPATTAVPLFCRHPPLESLQSDGRIPQVITRMTTNE